MKRLLKWCAGAVALGAVACGSDPGTSNQPGQDGGTPVSDGGSPHTDGGSASSLSYTSNLEVIVEPSDNGDGLLSAIQGAKKSIHMTMYQLSDSDVVTALISRKRAGVEVKVVLNQNFPSTQGNPNASNFTKLQNAGVQVVWASSSFNYTHEKCVIIDNQVAWIMTMNTTASSASGNREYLGIDHDPQDIAEAEQIFEADFAHSPVTPNGALLVAPVNVKDRLRALVATATSSIDVEVEELSDVELVTDLTIHADNRQKVRVVLANGTLTSAQQSAATRLKQHGVSVVQLSSPYVHAKAIVVDNARAYIGSANFTTNSLTANRELGLVTNNQSVVSTVDQTISGDFSNGQAF